MLAAFRWNLRLLSYISLVLGLSLFTTRSPSRCSAPPGDWNRARSRASRGSFCSHSSVKPPASGSRALSLGFPSAALWQWCGSVDGRHCGIAICQQPAGTIELSAASVLLALAVGVGVAVLFLFACARGFPGFSGRGDGAGPPGIDVRVRKARDLWLALVLGLAAAAASRAPAVAGKPFLLSRRDPAGGGVGAGDAASLTL